MDRKSGFPSPEHARWDEAASCFIAARETRRPLLELPPGCAPRSLDEACSIQEVFARNWGPRVIGYKIGCASKESQRLAGSPGPFTGRLFAPSCFESPAEIHARDFFVVGVEAEFAFRLGADLPARGAPYHRMEVAAAVSTVLPAIEICDTRLADWKTAGIEHIVADNGFGGGVVLGSPCSAWQELDLARHEVGLSMDGVVRGRGTGELVLGHPLDALAWIANDLVRRGHSLKAGDIVASGTCTGLHFAGPGAEVIADFGVLGRVEMHVRP